MARGCAVAILLASLGPVASAAAPAQLLNKTVSLSFVMQEQVREPDGRTHDIQVRINFTDYISSAGRVFERSSRAVGAMRQAGNKDPDATRNGIGESRASRLEGDKLVILNAFASGAIRIVVSFDPSFSSCSAEILMAREGRGPIRRKGLDGITRDILSATPSAPSCSVRQGNAFAN